MKLLFVFLFFTSSSLLGQTNVDTCTRLPFVNTGGLVAYYFWEEDNSGVIVPGSLKKPCVQNVYVVRNDKKRVPKKVLSSARMQQLVTDFAASNHNYAVTTIKEEGETHKESYPLLRYSAQQYGSIHFVKKSDQWSFNVRKPVLYFSIWNNGSMTYSHSSDSIVLKSKNYAGVCSGQYIVNTFYAADGSISHQSVVNYEGIDVTEMLFSKCAVNPKRCLVFVNGYRGPLKDKDKSDNLVSTKDRYGYWYKLDNRFIDRLKPDASFFLDANFSVSTSVHNSRLGFGRKLLRWYFSSNPKCIKRQLKKRLKTSNEEGFNFRKEKGRIAGLAFVYSKCTGPNCSNVKDTIDIVCHSMGYAYTLGFLESLEGKVVLGTCYIIAPENASIAGYDWSKFQHVWQYGSNFDQENPDALCYQDGVAPQLPVNGLDKLDGTQGGRIFFPSDWPNKGFIHSHMVYSYDWIFDRIYEGMPGYVGR